MLLTFLIQMCLGIVTGIFSLLPSWTVDSSTVTSMAGWGAVGGSANGYVPENELLLCFALVIGVRLFFLTWAGVLFLYRLIPFNG